MASYCRLVEELQTGQLRYHSQINLFRGGFRGNTILEGNELVDQHSCRADPWPCESESCGPSGPALGSRPDPRVDTPTRSSLLVGIIYLCLGGPQSMALVILFNQ